MKPVKLLLEQVSYFPHVFSSTESVGDMLASRRDGERVRGDGNDILLQRS